MRPIQNDYGVEREETKIETGSDRCHICNSFETQELQDTTLEAASLNVNRGRTSEICS
jgi:hypothetical protein